MIVIGPRQVAAKRRRPAKRTRIFEDEAIFSPQAWQKLEIQRNGVRKFRPPGMCQSHEWNLNS